MYTHIHRNLHTHTHTYIHTYTCACIYTYTFAYTCVYTYKYTYIHIHIHIHICVPQVLNGASAALLNLDRTFRIELQFLANEAVQLLSDKVDERIVECFPTELKAVTLPQCEKQLKALRETHMVKLCSRASQSSVDAMLKIVGKMVAGSPPADSMRTGGQVFSQAWVRLAFFVRHEASGVCVFGEKALELQLADLEAKIEKEKRVAKLFELDVFKAGI